MGASPNNWQKIMTNTNLFPKFALSTDFSSAVPTKWDDVKALMKSAQVKNICLQLQQLDPKLPDYGKQKEALKKQLPQLMVHACGFEGNHRNSHNAWWNGCVCLDYDHLTEEEINAIRQTEPPCPGIILAGRSCSGTGVFFIVEVPNSEFLSMRATLEAVHDAYTHALKVNHALDISNKIDILTDLARCRYLPTYDYIWWDAVEDFQSEHDQEAPYQSMYGDVIQTCAALDTNIPEGSSAQQAYNTYAAKVKTLTDNPLVMLKYLPDLGLTEKQRKDIIGWTEKNVQTKQKQAIPINLYQQPIDVEALPLPFKALPKVMQVMLKRYPAVWQRSAFFCTLPAFSAACGQLTQENGKPLVFQVALFGEHQTGKTEFSAKPATIIQDYIARDDNQRRYNIRKAEDNRDTDEKKLSPPCVIPFINTSTPQVMKYLRFAKEQTIMAYEGDISSSLAGKDCAFLNLKYLLR